MQIKTEDSEELKYQFAKISVGLNCFMGKAEIELTTNLRSDTKIASHYEEHPGNELLPSEMS